MNQNQIDAVRLGIVPPYNPQQCLGPCTPYDSKLPNGFRIACWQAVRPRYESKWVVFKNGSCVETGVESAESARVYIVAKLKEESAL